MNKEWHLIIHTCLEVKGNGPDCQQCLVLSKDFCVRMVDLINKICQGKSLSGLDNSRIQDIVSESIAAIQDGISNFREEVENSFEKWARRIIRNKRADYFRRKYKKQEISPELTKVRDNNDNDDNGFDCIPDLSLNDLESKQCEIEVEDYISTLTEKVIQGKIMGIDIDLITKYYNYLKEGLSQKEIAIEMNMKPNTLSQELGRIRKKLYKEGKMFSNE